MGIILIKEEVIQSRDSLKMKWKIGLFPYYNCYFVAVYVFAIMIIIINNVIIHFIAINYCGIPVNVFQIVAVCILSLFLYLTLPKLSQFHLLYNISLNENLTYFMLAYNPLAIS